jgi:hypothetical protein
MRHMRSLIIAIIVAPLAWVLLALGQVRSTGAFPGAGQGGALHTADFVRPMVLLAGAGLLLGILGLLRLSPLGALVIGVVFTLSYTILLVAPSQVVDLLGRNVSVMGRHIDLAAPIRTGTTMMLGVVLLVGTVSMRRWQRWPGQADETAEAVTEDDRPLGTDGLGPVSRYRDLEMPRYQDTEIPRYQDSEPEPAARYPMSPLRVTAPEPYVNGPWAGTDNRPPSRERTAASGTSYGW